MGLLVTDLPQGDSTGTRGCPDMTSVKRYVDCDKELPFLDTALLAQKEMELLQAGAVIACERCSWPDCDNCVLVG